MVSLYRKWRSRSFDDLIGQQHVVRTLRNAVRQRRVTHAYLFTGPRGTGKTSMARILAKAINCRNPQDGNPCDRCETCLAANEGRAMDVIEIDAASNTSVDNVRDLRDRVAYAAGEGQYKVYIIDEVHRLSGAAFDAFLKTLEEPPPHVIFVFASTEPHKVPETIASRCQRFDFRRHSLSDVVDRLTYVAAEEQFGVSEDAFRLIALHAHGSLRDALGLLEQVAAYTEGQIDDSEVRSALGLADAALVGQLTECLLNGEIGAGLTAFQRFVDEAGDSRQLTRQLVEYWQALLLRVTGVAAQDVPLDPALSGAFETQAGRSSAAQLVAALRALSDQEFGSRFNLPPTLPFELGYVQAASAFLPQTEAAPPRPDGSPPASDPEPSPVVRILPQAQTVDPPPAPAPLRVSEPRPLPSLQGASPDTAWPAIVESMRARSRHLQALLRSAHVVQTQDGEITIGFPFAFHRNQVAEPKWRKLVEQVVAEVTGATYRVNCVLVSADELRTLKGDSHEDDDGFVEELTERLRQVHTQQLGNGNS